MDLEMGQLQDGGGQHEEGQGLDEPHGHATLQSLPLDVKAEVLSRVGASSLEDLYRTQLVCKDFKSVGNYPIVYKRASVDKFSCYDVRFVRKQEVLDFMGYVASMDNGNWLFRQGCMRYFSDNEPEAAIEDFRVAAKEGHVLASYVYGMILLSVGGPSAFHGLHVLETVRREFIGLDMGRVLGDIRERAKRPIWALWIRNQLTAPTGPKPCGHGDPIDARRTWDGLRIPLVEPFCYSCLWHLELEDFISSVRRQFW